MADFDHQHKKNPVPDLVEHPVVTHADPVVVGVARELLATCWPGIRMEAPDRVCHPDSDLRGKLEELSLGGGKELELIPARPVSHAWLVLSRSASTGWAALRF